MGILSERPVEKITAEIACRVEPGKSDKILWLHGYTLDSSSWGEIWALLPDWHHIGIDLPGHGASAPLAESSNLRDFGHSLGKVCIAHDIRHIVALSFGTITAVQLAIQFPKFFSSIVLGAPAIAGGPQDPSMATVYYKLITLYQYAGPTQDLQSLWMGSRPWRGIEKHPGLHEALSSLVACHSWEELESYSKILQFFSPAQKENDLAHIQSPMLILVGEGEMSAFRECADILQRCVPNCRQCELPDTDHLCMLQSPQLAARLIDEHLRKQAVSAPAAGA